MKTRTRTTSRRLRRRRIGKPNNPPGIPWQQLDRMRQERRRQRVRRVVVGPVGLLALSIAAALVLLV